MARKQGQFVRKWGMNGSLVIRRGLKWTAGALAAVVIMAVVLAAALNAGYCRGPLVRFLGVRAGRQVDVAGSLQMHVFSLNPEVIAERVTIGNPPWTSSGLTAEIGKITVVFETPSFDHWIDIKSLDMEAATLHLLRDSVGHANWQRTDPDKGGDTPLPLIRSLSMTDAHVTLADALRHLQFDGSVSVQDAKGTGTQLLRIDGVGQLNGRSATFEITGDPLATIGRGRPYHFTFSERSSGSRLMGRGSLSQPFTFDVLDTAFEATGPDLKDIYILTGVALVNTGSYHLSGKLARRGTNSKFSDLLLTFGESDVRGTVSIETSSGRPKLDAHLDSQVLRLSDLGLHAAGRDGDASTGGALLLSDATLSPSVVRRGEAAISFRARRVDVGRVSLRAVATGMTIDHGVLVVAPLSADVLEGKLNARLRLDARTDVPVADLDLKITDLQLGQLDQKGTGPPRIEGLLRLIVAVTGRGSSIHQVAASANGSVTAVLPHGIIRTSLAELTGIDLRGLGLLLTKSQQETSVRCGIAKFQERDGTLIVQTLIVDTDAVLITGGGQIHLDSETLDLVFRGHPKSLRILRLRSPLSVRGTLLHPSISIHGGDSVLVLVDPGSAKDVDCASL